MSNAAGDAVIQEYYRELKLAAVVRDYPFPGAAQRGRRTPPHGRVEAAGGRL